MLLRCLLAAGSVLVSLVGLELGLRLFWDGYYLKVSEPYAMPHATRGWCNLPDTVVTDGEPEFLVTATHDRFGHRGAPVARERTPGRPAACASSCSGTPSPTGSASATTRPTARAWRRSCRAWR
jgi:hypothetical protein